MRHPFDRDNERLLAIMRLAAEDIDKMCTEPWGSRAETTKKDPAATMEAATGRH